MQWQLEHFSLWRDSARDLAEDGSHVHVWKSDLDVSMERLTELGQLLWPDEQARAERFRFAGDRARFIAARGSLRIVLGQYLRLPPQQVPISCTSQGKPTLAGTETLRFNVSHSEALALIAVTRRREIGVDVEFLRTDFDPDALAKRFYAPAEYAALGLAPPAEKHVAFLTYWTCKEAYLKALGTGLRSSLRNFTVSLDDASIILTAIPGKNEVIAPFRLHHFHPVPGYVAALAIEELPQG